MIQVPQRDAILTARNQDTHTLIALCHILVIPIAQIIITIQNFIILKENLNACLNVLLIII